MENTSNPPRSNSANPASPFAKCNDARFCEPASVQSKLPFPKPNAARCCFNSFFPFAPQQKRTDNPHTLQALPQNSRLQRLNIDRDVRQFRHGSVVAQPLLAVLLRSQFQKEFKLVDGPPNSISQHQ